MSLDTINQSFILAEEEALKAKIAAANVAVPASRNGPTNPVSVWYRWPEKEYSENLFPFITLDLIDVEFDAPRAHSYNWDSMNYLPDAVPDSATPQEYIAPFPIPVELHFTVSTYCRNAIHDRHLLRRLQQWDLFIPKFGYLDVETDNTRRRLDILDGPTEAHYHDNLNKRVFRRIFTIGINAEMLPEEAYQAQEITKVVFEQVLLHIPAGQNLPASPVH